MFYGTPASSTTKTDRHDIAEILLKVALKLRLGYDFNQTEKTSNALILISTFLLWPNTSNLHVLQLRVIYLFYYSQITCKVAVVVVNV
jgi:hypothetical protein